MKENYRWVSFFSSSSFLMLRDIGIATWSHNVLRLKFRQNNKNNFKQNGY